MPPRIILVHQFDQQQAETETLQFSFDGKRLVSSDGYVLYLWQLHDDGNGSYERSLPFCHAVRSAFVLDGKWLAFSDYKGLSRLISLENETEEKILPCPARANGAISPDQRWLVTGDGDAIFSSGICELLSTLLFLSPFQASERNQRTRGLRR
ncbi:MAG TPA: hypothetical protein VFV38_18555 [Ktedonobacteraceae bacterium]|nr:hypothetical protein [Ktedonobacteraceae bacterium]